MSFGSSSQESQSSSNLPEWYVPYAKESLKRGQQIANQGYTPYMGADVAAFNPTQVGAMQDSANWNAAFNTPGQAAPDVAASLPKAQDFGNGMQGYSSYNGYLDQLETLKSKYPGMFRMMEAQAINPVTGQQGNFPPSAPRSPSGNQFSGGGEGGLNASIVDPGASFMQKHNAAINSYDPSSREAILFGTGGGGGGGGGGDGGGGGFDFNAMLNGMLGMGGGSASLEGIGNFWDPNNQQPGTYRSWGNNPFITGSNNTFGMGNMGFGSRRGTD